MLKKVFAVSAICAMSCGISFGKNTALELVESSLKNVSDLGIEYSCSGGDTYAKCNLKDINTIFASFTNVSLETTLTDYQYKEKISGKIINRFGKDTNKFIPNRFECNSDNNLNVDDLDNYVTGQCALYSDVATLKLDIDFKTHSKLYRYKTMPTIIANNIAMFEKINKSLQDRDTQYYKKLESLRNDRNAKIDEMQDEIDSVKMQLREKENDSKCVCGTCGKDKKDLQESYSKKSYEMTKIREYYGEAYDSIQKEYDDGVQEDIDSLITFLKQYNLEIKEIRIYLKSNSLADYLLNLSANGFFSFNENIPLTKEQKLDREEQKKKIMARYYSHLESSRAAAITFIEESPYLSNQLKTTLSKIVKQNTKLYDPNADTISTKILITPINKQPINIGDEISKLKVAYSNDDANDDNTNFTKSLFDIINQYDIRVVREWPQD